MEKLLLINQELKDSCFEMPEKLLCFHVLHNVAKFNQHFISGYKEQNAGDATWTDSFQAFWTKFRAAIRADGLSKDVINHNQQSSDILTTNSGRDMELENLKAQVALLAAKLDNRPRSSHAVATVLATRSAPTSCQELRIPPFPAQDTWVHWQGAGGGHHLRLPGCQGLPRGSGSNVRGAQSQGALHGAQW